MRALRVGILGDGQLAKMLVEAAYPLGITPVIYSDSQETALSSICPQIIKGERNNFKTLSQFLKSVDLVIFESEFFERKHLEDALKISNNPTPFFPSLTTMEALRDKLNQKKVLKKLKILTSDFIELVPEENIESWLRAVEKKFKGNYVLKWGRLGYDGKGVFFPTKQNFSDAIQFCKRSREAGVSLFAEERIKFKRELAITGCYSIKREFKSYPLVVSVQENGICVQVMGPAINCGVSKALDSKAKKTAESLAKHLNLFGCFSIEFFETSSGKLLVNELAPRVHNSAHYTQNGSDTSQFENHLRAVTGLKLGSCNTAPFFSMLNLLGPEGVDTTNDKAPLPRLRGSTHLHWYSKQRITPGRKIGHLNAATLEKKRQKEIVKELKQIHKEWISMCQEKV